MDFKYTFMCHEPIMQYMYSNIKNNSFIFYLVYVINGDIINLPLLPTHFYDIKD